VDSEYKEQKEINKMTENEIIKIGNDTGVITNIFKATDGSALVKLQMVKNAFGQGRHEILPEDVFNDMVSESNKTAMLLDIERHITRILITLHSTLPLTKEQVIWAVNNAIEGLLNNDKE
jgi:CMP-N-acetylneuraminic acid synthetase